MDVDDSDDDDLMFCIQESVRPIPSRPAMQHEDPASAAVWPPSGLKRPLESGATPASSSRLSKVLKTDAAAANQQAKAAAKQQAKAAAKQQAKAAAKQQAKADKDAAKAEKDAAKAVDKELRVLVKQLGDDIKEGLRVPTARAILAAPPCSQLGRAGRFDFDGVSAAVWAALKTRSPITHIMDAAAPFTLTKSSL
eukprot:5395164-Prymnesium_polylepis.2